MSGIEARDLALLGALALGGVLVWRELDTRAQHSAGNAAAGGEVDRLRFPGGGLLSGGVMPSGAASPARDNSGDLLKAQRVDTLRRDLSRVHNDIDVLVVQANSVKNRPVDPAFKQATIDGVWSECKSKHKLFPTTACLQSGTAAKAEAAVGPAWAARLALELQPIQAQLSRLNAEQQAIVSNLAALGVNMPVGSTKAVTV